MKNPFVKEKDNTALIVSIAAGAIAAGAIAYLFMTDSGVSVREKLSESIKEVLKDAASDIVSKKTSISKKTVKAVADHVVK